MKVLMFILIAVMVSAQDNYTLEDTRATTDHPLGGIKWELSFSPDNPFLYSDSLPDTMWIVDEPFYFDTVKVDTNWYKSTFEYVVLMRLDSLEKRLDVLEKSLFNAPKTKNPRTIIFIED